jgi:hypothetical protein
MMFKSSVNFINRHILIFFPIIWSLGPAIQDIAISFTAITFFFFSIKNNNFEFLYDKISWILIAFFISIIISSAFSPVVETSIYKSSTYIRYLLFFFAVNYLIKLDSGDFRKFFIFNIIFIIFLALDIWLQKINGTDIFGFKPGMDGMRNSGFFGDELIAGGFIVKTFFLTLIYFLLINLKKFYLFSFYLFILITVFLTGERMSLILFIIGTILFVFIYKDYLRYKLFTFITILLSVIIFFILNPQAHYRTINQTFNQIIYGHTDKYHKYFDIEISQKYRLAELQNLNKKDFIFDYDNDYLSYSPSLKIQNLIKIINKETKYFKVTDLKKDAYQFEKIHYEKIDIQIEYVRGYKIKKLRNNLNKIISNSEIKTLSRVEIKLKNPKEFTLKKSLPLIDTGWGAHFLAAINIWKDKPLFGSGLKSFRALCGFEKYKTISKNDAFRCSTHPHNFYFELLAETGLFGFILLVSFFILILKKINFFQKENKIFFSIIFILSIWPLGTSGSLFNNHNAGYFWFIISLSCYVLNKKNLFITTNN